MTLQDELNERQKAGVEAIDGPVLVLAGAGSGKTKMLTARIVHLMRRHEVPPQNILAVTFTNKAAVEMRSRVSRALGYSPDALTPPPSWMSRSSAASAAPTIGTFHSICTRILRNEIERTDFNKQFVIYDDSDQLSLVKNCFAQLQLSEKTFSPKSFQHSINAAKCSALEPHELQNHELNLYSKNLARVYELYQKELIKNNAVDFGEIITLSYRLLRDNPDILKKYQDLYRYIHVDEYQDTNRAQYLLVRLLAAGHRNICVVGDEDQSIYKWRGADIRNILDFEKDYPDAVVVKLEQNYRSTQTIINASAHVIANNTARKAKTLWTDNEVGERIRRFQTPDDRSEAELVVAQLKQECATNGYAFGDVAIFYRTNAQSRVFEDVLRRERIPYKVIGGLRFYDRKEIKDILAYFRVLVNADDGVSFKRIINVPQRSIGKTTVDKIEDHGLQHGLSFEKALRQLSSEGSDLLSGATKRKTAEFLKLLEDLRSLSRLKTLSEFYHELIDRTRYVEELKQENTEESLSRIENLQEFDSILIEFEAYQRQAGSSETAYAETTLPAFLENVTLVGEQEEAEHNASGNISLMTLHTSKGLEFPLVFMVGLEEGLFPSIRQYEEESEEDIEEERRLCYVGMTRAKQRLYMTHAVCRRVYGNIVYHEPARFFQEIPDEFIQFNDLSRSSRPQLARPSFLREAPAAAPSRQQQPRPSTTGDAPHVGLRVRHGTYGLGIVRGVEGSEQNIKVTIEFSNHLTKKFALKFAQLEYL